MATYPPQARKDLIAVGAEPVLGCAICPRLHNYLKDARENHPGWYNQPVASFGSEDARLLIVGLAPGMRGANRTGRPFTGDFAGDLLYATLHKFGFANDKFAAAPDDGLELTDAAVTNAVRCVPPENKPTGGEITNCRPYLTATIAAHKNLRAIVCLGRISHDSTLRALGLRLASHPFAHSAQHTVDTGSVAALTLFDSYHCSRYNTNTGRLTPQMFETVFANVRAHLDAVAD